MRVNTIFGQIVQLLSRREFKKIVKSFKGDYYTKKMDCWQQLMILLFAQLRELDSLRAINTAIRSCSDRWAALGVETSARSTLADANSKRNYQIFEELFYKLLKKCQSLAPHHGFRLNFPVFTQDSTLIPLCLSAFPWAKYRKRKGAIKLHMLIDHEGSLPSFIRMTDGKCHDVNAVKDPKYDFPLLPPDSILTVDRGYLDFAWLNSLAERGVIFIIRAKHNMDYKVIGQHRKPLKNKHIINDELIELSGFYGQKHYPDPIRLVRYEYQEKNGDWHEISVMTNNLKLASSTIAALYKGRWEIETFFRWIKQNLRIKSFIGTSENAVMTQVWVAMILYLLLSFIKFQTRFMAPLSELLRILREVALETKSLIDYLRINWKQFCQLKQKPIQMALW
jgi:hypothetical protein